ncbi:MAG: Piwi domain-containing protein [Candidatus Heimdallarchaeaceae archaeon]
MNYTINLFPASLLVQEVSIYFTPNTISQLPRLHNDYLPKSIKLDSSLYNEEGYTHWWVTPLPKSKSITIPLSKASSFVRRVLTAYVAEWFSNKAATKHNFINDLEVWIIKEEGERFVTYKKFTIRIDFSNVIKTWGLFISYDGESFVTTKPYSNLPAIKENVSRVLRENRVMHIDSSDSLKPADKVVLNRKIAFQLQYNDIPFRKYEINKYAKFHKEIISFAQSYLLGKDIMSTIRVFDGNLARLQPIAVKRVAKENNLLEFGGGHKNFNPVDGMKLGGPYRVPYIENLFFIFIFPNHLREVANRLHVYLKKGYRNFPGLEQYTRVPYELDIKYSIKFNSVTTCISEVSDRLTSLPKNKRYFAFYLSPTTAEEDAQSGTSIYPELKQLLLQHNISSQVVEAENVHDHNFNFYLTNIAVATIAKLGGIPWQLPYPIRNELVIGFGAFRTYKKSLLGNAICFDNCGHFYEFNTFHSNELKMLHEQFLEYIHEFMSRNKKFERLIIHYFKQPGLKEHQLIKNVLDSLQLTVPYIFVRVNETESKDYVVFDEDFSGLMPVSGTFVRLYENTFLLCNNSRYSRDTRQKIISYPFPIKIRLFVGPGQSELNEGTVEEIIEQTYQFSRLYWRSIRQQHLPVTVKYSKLVAGQALRFPKETLPSTQLATKSLWFL